MVDPDSVAPFDGMRTLVIGFATVMPTPELAMVPAELVATDIEV
jgi:hypothetical protein